MEESLLIQNIDLGTEGIGLSLAAVLCGTVQGPTISSPLVWTVGTLLTLLDFANATICARKAGA